MDAAGSFSRAFFPSEDISITLALILIICCALYRLFSRKHRLPPGPIGLPIFGYLPFLTKKPYVKFQELAKTYGPVFRLKIGSRNAIVLCDFQSIKEAFNSDAFMGWPPESPLEISKETKEKGILSGKKWEKQRNFSLQALKELGFSKRRMEENIKEEICYILEQIRSAGGEAIFLGPILASSTSNNISSFIFGRRMPHGDERRVMLDGILRDTTKAVTQVGILSFFPWFAKIVFFFKFGNYGKFTNAIRLFKEFMEVEISEHEQTLDSENTRDFIDAYLLQIEKHGSDPDSDFLKPVLQDLVSGFFGAGSDTPRVTLEWLLLTTASFPDVQDKIHQEIDEVIGRERFPMWTDRIKMPFTEAVMHEVMRWTTIIPINLLKYTLEDTVLNGYDIPRNSYVIADHWAVQHDPVLWKEPHSFRPERFLSKDGKTVRKPEHFIPFSIGKRSCPGESFALIEMFLYLTAILQKFEVCLPEGAVPDFEGELGIATQPKPQKLQLKLRQ